MSSDPEQASTSTTAPHALSAEEWPADLYAGYSTPPAGISLSAVVLHDRAEEQAYAERWMYGDPPRRATSEFINGIFCHVDTGGGDRADGEIIAALSPALNAYKVKYLSRPGGGGGERPEFTADHHFVRLTPPATADDPVRQVYAHCTGCVERGYHLPTTDVSCAAFGSEPPPKRAYRDVAAKERLAAMTSEERGEWEAEQARLRAQLEENRQRNAPEVERRREGWRREHAGESG